MSTYYSTPIGAGFMEGSIDPLLERLYHTRTQFEAQDGDSDDMRQQLCTDMTLVLKSSDKPVEREMCADILLSLLKKADKTLKYALSERLSVLPNVPLRLVLQLVGEGADIANPVLRYSDALNDLDLLYIIQSRDAAYWRVIAAREYLGEGVVDALIDTKDCGTVCKLIDNKTIGFSDYALRGLESLAIEDSTVAEKALIRRDIPAKLVEKLYAYVGKSIQNAIEQEYGPLSQQIVENINDVIGEFVLSEDESFVPSGAMIRAADMFMFQGKLTSLLMIRTLKRGQLASFVAQFSAYSGLPVMIVMALFDQHERKGLAVVSKASGLTRQEFITILMLTSKLPQKTALTSDDISAAIDYFDRVKERVALRLLMRVRH